MATARSSAAAHEATSRRRKARRSFARKAPAASNDALGGVAGQALTEAASRHKASLDLADLRGQFHKYRDEYQANVRPFANPARPLEFANLRVIAFVQDDSTHEILQAVQVAVEGK